MFKVVECEEYNYWYIGTRDEDYDTFYVWNDMTVHSHHTNYTGKEKGDMLHGCYKTEEEATKFLNHYNKNYVGG